MKKILILLCMIIMYSNFAQATTDEKKPILQKNDESTFISVLPDEDYYCHKKAIENIILKKEKITQKKIIFGLTSALIISIIIIIVENII